MHYHGISEYFEVTVTADDVVNKKPDPEILLKTIEKLDAEVMSTLYVGDSNHDLEAASRIGMPFVLDDTGIFVQGERRKNLRTIAEEKGYPIINSDSLMEICTVAAHYILSPRHL